MHLAFAGKCLDRGADGSKPDLVHLECQGLRQEQQAVEAQLVAKEEELEAATTALAKEREHLVEVRHQLTKSLADLRERLVSIYEAGSPDILNAIIESENWSSMAAQTEYLNRIQSYDNSVVTSRCALSAGSIASTCA